MSRSKDNKTTKSADPFAASWLRPSGLKRKLPLTLVPTTTEPPQKKPKVTPVDDDIMDDDDIDNELAKLLVEVDGPKTFPSASTTTSVMSRFEHKQHSIQCLNRQQSWYEFFGVKKTHQELLEHDILWKLNATLIEMGIISANSLVAGLESHDRGFFVDTDLALRNLINPTHEIPLLIEHKLADMWADVLQKAADTITLLRACPWDSPDAAWVFGEKLKGKSISHYIRPNGNANSKHLMRMSFLPFLRRLFVNSFGPDEESGEILAIGKLVLNAISAGWLFWPSREELAKILGIDFQIEEPSGEAVAKLLPRIGDDSGDDDELLIVESPQRTNTQPPKPLLAHATNDIERDSDGWQIVPDELLDPYHVSPPPSSGSHALCPVVPKKKKKDKKPTTTLSSVLPSQVIVLEEIEKLKTEVGELKKHINKDQPSTTTTTTTTTTVAAPPVSSPSDDKGQCPICLTEIPNLETLKAEPSDSQHHNSLWCCLKCHAGFHIGCIVQMYTYYQANNVVLRTLKCPTCRTFHVEPVMNGNINERGKVMTSGGRKVSLPYPLNGDNVIVLTNQTLKDYQKKYKTMSETTRKHYLNPAFYCAFFLHQ